jgi:hypothetical protein
MLVICLLYLCWESHGVDKMFTRLVNAWFGKIKFNFIHLKELELQGPNSKLKQMLSVFFVAKTKNKK